MNSVTITNVKVSPLRSVVAFSVVNVSETQAKVFANARGIHEVRPGTASRPTYLQRSWRPLSNSSPKATLGVPIERDRMPARDRTRDPFLSSRLDVQSHCNRDGGALDQKGLKSSGATDEGNVKLIAKPLRTLSDYLMTIKFPRQISEETLGVSEVSGEYRQQCRNEEKR